ncbi:pyridoxal-dependent decarboxylase [Tricharina praecox]|uniref:pyridoxal-dependent decarboxylase n=1 Tax=Tricharina praecox TaxID=43433 RepID=UPI00221E662A|nr:pyridoxal-dependent decarboxylase [Tricharina praecox]KAI5849982.1 pyridoxal-dependent decarboxylase [Tricharina praecox]
MAPVALGTSPVTSKLSPQQRRFSQSNACTRSLAQAMIGHALQTHIESIDPDECDAGAEDAFFVADLGEIYRQHMRWKVNLPRIEPFYAVKCNQDPKVLQLLAALGTGFDCASKTEIQQVIEMGVDPMRIIYANPCKTASYVRYAAEENIRMMTFDNPEELYKVKKFFPDAMLFLRISTDDSKSLCRLSLKYGAPLDSTADLLRLAKELGLNVVGVSFHVGSGSYDPTAFATAVKDARKVFDEAAEIGYDLRTLDVGGGYGNDNFEQIASVLGPAVDKYFPSSVRVIAEPGRYYVESAFTIATHVIARRTVQDELKAGQQSYMLYMNDGVYGNFSGIMFDHQIPVPRVLKRGSDYHYNSPPTRGVQLTECSVWGPTCDGIDCISKSCFLPEVLEVGDWLYFTNMGAYSKCSATKFNGFSDDHRVIYVVSEAGAQAMLA